MMKAKDVKSIVWNLSLLTAGSLICALAINGILLPQKFVAGGFTGMAILIHYLVSDLSVGLLYLILNVPVYILGWMYVGRRFFFYSLAGLLVFSGAMMAVQFRIPLADPLLSALLAGILSGIGTGIILRSLGCAGGTDILAIILLKRFSIRIGTTMLIFNALLLAVTAFLFTIEAALYALIFIFVTSRLVDVVVTGLNQRKLVMVNSRKWKEIEASILDRLNRGVTLVYGEGGYKGERQMLLYTVITFQELSRLKSLIRDIDPNAFVVISETLEVMGQRIGNQPHW
jgi:uncharacterized membrane-anchored protein YitT (DUF2179 family)